jgi:hypothetical protein
MSVICTEIDNLRQLRVLQVLKFHPMTREQVNSTAGCSNGPDLMSDLRDLFPQSANRNKYISCVRINFLDCDGRVCRPGIYSLTGIGCRLMNQWLVKREGARHG